MTSQRFRAWLAALSLVLALPVAPLRAQTPAGTAIDTDGDGVPDASDCAPADPGLSTPHTYYWDLDGDQYGDPAHPVVLCTTMPFPGTTLWSNDPDDTKVATIGRMVAKGSREIGLDFLDGPASGRFSPDLARELGASVLTVTLEWNQIETAPGVFDGPQAGALRILDGVAASEGFALNLTVAPIVQSSLTLPADLAASVASGQRLLSDPEIVNRFERLLDFVHQTLAHATVTTLQLGHEVDLLLPTQPGEAFWGAYAAWFASERTYAKALWGAALPVGITATYRGLLEQPAASLMQVLNGGTDVISVTYLPRSAEFTVPAVAAVPADIQMLVALAYPRPLSFQSVGYASASRAGSSTTQQTQFFQALFDTWDMFPELIPFMSFAHLYDMSPARAASETQTAPSDLHDAATTWLASTGLRKWDGDGAGKPAYQTLRTLAFNRGWWRVRPNASRSFLLGMTPALYDHNPGGPLIPEVLDTDSRGIGATADLITYYFDEGVPWPEAFADNFQSSEPPYSANVREVWNAYRSRRPPGAKVAVAINALGIPRKLTAPYWGVGEGFYHDDNFNLVGTGVVQDYQERLRPPPWDGYALDSPQVKQAYLNYCRRVIDYFHPDYLITGVEVNLTLEEDVSVFAKWLELQRYVYTALRANPAYANVKIVVSFVAEDLITDEIGVPLHDGAQQLGVDARHLAALSQIAPYVDVIGLSVYPIKSRYLAYQIPANFFDDLFAKLRQVTDKPIAITETGYPAASFEVNGTTFVSDPAKQARYLRFLFSEVEKHGGVEFVNLFGLRDMTAHLTKLRARSLEMPPFISPALAEFFKYFEFIGLEDANGQPREAEAIVVDQFHLGLETPETRVPELSMASPGGDVRATLSVDATGRLTYSLMRAGHLVLEASPLGITVDGVDLGTRVTNLVVADSQEHSETFAVRGVHAVANNHYGETSVFVRRAGDGDLVYVLQVRLFDDGLAWRYLVPGEGSRTVSGEASGWRLPAGSRLWHQVNTFNYESSYRVAEIGQVDDDIGGPVTVELPGDGGLLTITEARLRAYSGMTFDVDLGSPLVRSEFLDDTAWTVSGGSVTPWRVVIAAASLDRLVNSDIVNDLNDAPDPALFPQGARTSWIRPGRAVWSWWSDFNSGYDFETQKTYVDYATRLRAEYALVDAWWEQGFPADGRDQFARLRELVDYAHSAGRSVGIWVWKNWYELTQPEARHAFLTAVHDAGVVGVKVDIIDAADSESAANVALYETILREAAALHLMINFHGCDKPTGLTRTYPNEITREGLAGLELNAVLWQQGQFISPEHNATLPFVRMIAGPGDYTPVTFDPRKLGETTFTHQLALAGLFTSPLLHFADNPSLLLGQPAVQDVLRTLPTEWDETVVLPPSGIGRLAAFARRKGSRWFVFAINGNGSAGVDLSDVPLSFLGSERYDALIVTDRSKTEFSREVRAAVTSTDRLGVQLLPGGGVVAVFSRAADATRAVPRSFTSLPASSSTQGLVATYTALRDQADLVTHVFDEGVPWAQAASAASAAQYPASLRARWETLQSADDAVFPSRPRAVLLTPLDRALDGTLSPFWDTSGPTSLPSPWTNYALDDPHVVTAFVNYAAAAIDFFHPAYLGIGIDANVVLARRPDRWMSLVSLLQQTYAALKARSPATQVFVGIQYEHLLGAAEESRRLAALVEDVYPDVLTQETMRLLSSSDALALTTYPSLADHNPFLAGDGTVDWDYFDLAGRVASDAGRPIAIIESGFSSRDVALAAGAPPAHGSDELQARFLSLLLHDTHVLPTEYVTNFIGVDYADAYGSSADTLQRAYTGLLRADQTPKPALAVWQQFAPPLSGTVSTSSMRSSLLPAAAASTADAPQPGAADQPLARVAKGRRILSIDATPTERATYDAFSVAQYFLGAQGVQLMLDWTDIEVSPGVYSDRYLTLINSYYAAHGATVSLTIRPVDAIHEHVPPDLLAEPFDSPQMIFRFFALLDFVFAKLPDVSLASLGIGNEIDEWLRLHPETFAAYKTFYDAALYHTKTIRPDLPVGVSANLHALVSGDRAEPLRRLNEFSDVLLVLYYPVSFDFTVEPISVVAGDVDALTARYPDKLIHFREAGYPSDAAPGGSVEAQQQFITAMFQAWDAHADQIRLVSFFRLTDFSPAQVDYYTGYYQSDTSAFRGFLAGLGLRTWAGDGEFKPAFWQLYIEARSRGW